MKKLVVWAVVILVALISITGSPSQAQTPDEDLTEDQLRTLNSLEQIDDHPLYVMHYYGDYTTDAQAVVPTDSQEWACALFAALADPDSMIYGRNFDWEHSPALLLFTHPTAGYDSVSMVDIAYLGLDEGLIDQPLEARLPLLNAPFWPFDGMNERGLTIGMAAIGQIGAIPNDPDRETIGSLGIMREVLDHAATVDEAIAIFEQYNIDFSGGPMIHYLIADIEGNSALLEFYEGELVIMRDQRIATNFNNALMGENSDNVCDRYDTIAARFDETGEQLTAESAMQLLSDASQSNTQWSIVYEMNTSAVHIAMRRHYDTAYTFELE